MNEMKKFIQDNALDVIEKFGGIRPMANKLGIAATTIQGWKKRESIPESRFEDIIRAANQNDIDLGFDERPNIEDTIAQIKARIEQPREDQQEPDEELMEFSSDEVTKPEEDAEPVKEEEEEKEDELTTSEEITPPPAFISEKSAQEEKIIDLKNKPETSSNEFPSEAANTNNNTKQSPRESKGFGSMAAVAVGLMVIGLAAVFWPVREDVIEQKEKLQKMQEDLQQVKDQQSTFMSAMSDYMPSDVKQQLESFKEQTSQLGAQVGELASQTREIAKTYIGEENTAEIERRLIELESQFSGLVNSAQVQNILARFSTMNDTEEGQQKLDRATGQLHGIIESLDGRWDLLGDSLVIARENSTALGETFEGIENKDLKAAALLLGLTQFRSALNRDNTPFEQDLALLYSVIGKDDKELRQSLDRLAPQAESGILTTQGLADEFRALAGDIAVNSFKGEDVTVADQAKARLSKVLQIKKGGETLLGSESNEKIMQVQNQLDSGDLRGAMATLSTFEGEASTAAEPFMQKIASSITALEVKTAINSMLEKAAGELARVKPLNLKNIKPSVTQQMLPNQIQGDSDSGFTILPQNKLKGNFKDLNVHIQE